jgi:hypothetical protein
VVQRAPSSRRRCTPFLQRTFHPGSGRPMAGSQPGLRGKAFAAGHGEPERARL